MSAQHALMTLLMEKLATNMLVLPTLPEIAVRVRQAADDPDINLHAMSEVIALDPALAARMIKIANSAFIGRSIKVSTLNQAVTRIGLSQVKNIATAMALEQLFVSHTAEVAATMADLWRDTVHVTCVAMACLKLYLPQHKHDNLNLDTLTLAALVHRIGVLPILVEAEKYPEVFAEPEFLRKATDELASRIGVAIMRHWGFADAFIEVVSQWRQPQCSETVQYTDFVRLGLLSLDYYRDRRDSDRLIEHYLKQELIPNRNFMQDAQIAAAVADAKAIFM
ncbi:HDOD domain-containing protein [Rheinheimera sp. 4Y26]|uniref:HDOD domain-containing protein n=1 Tax=Rheinheimera sp. 4Y26 TaxID=2977811 RepID=UPI0021B115FD|nr:HDOD domain-containing protein [Rheinheimera sp. 4Y26]MCT6698926.1 HDOD domain-containing protein [Rheinheimera sp. 4Y26]